MLLAKRSMATLMHFSRMLPYHLLLVLLIFDSSRNTPIPEAISHPSCVPRWCMSGPPSPSIRLCILCMSVAVYPVYVSPLPLHMVMYPVYVSLPSGGTSSPEREGLLLGDPSELVGSILSMTVSHNIIVILRIYTQVFITVKGRYQAEITLFRYNNTPPGKCQEYDFGQQMWGCCDSHMNFHVCEGGELCDVYFTYCLRRFGSTGSGCSNYTNVTSSVGNDLSSFSFPQQDMNVLGLSNPLLLPGLTDAYTVRLS